MDLCRWNLSPIDTIILRHPRSFSVEHFTWLSSWRAKPSSPFGFGRSISRFRALMPCSRRSWIKRSGPSKYFVRKILKSRRYFIADLSIHLKVWNLNIFKLALRRRRAFWWLLYYYCPCTRHLIKTLVCNIIMMRWMWFLVLADTEVPFTVLSHPVISSTTSWSELSVRK